ADALAGEVDRLATEARARVRPLAGPHDLSLEAFGAGEVDRLGQREAAHGEDEEARVHAVATIGVDRPQVVGLVEAGRGDARLELDIATEVEAIRYLVDVAEHRRLVGEAVGPVPLLVELGG